MSNVSKPADTDLQRRLAQEAQFHDAKYSGEDLYPRHYKVSPTVHVYAAMMEMLGDLRGKRVLEYGCGEGWITRDLAAKGATVEAFDVSPQAVENTKSVLAKAGLLERCTVRTMPAEQLDYPDATFDVAIGFAIIHHLDLGRAFAELHRVMKPGGLSYFAEPLGTNPLINIYRRMTPQFRTVDERPLYLKEMQTQLRAFSGFEHQEYYLTALGAFAFVYVPGLSSLFGPVSRALHRVDRALLKVAPGLGSWAWYTILKIRK
jgi:2-polyprenyl-3-methyl-5-hydroxy-6-metoxy-1,4-benzoquinol methylase